MPYLVDGHNLIPKIPGFSLAEVDDEMQLVELLQDFCQRQGKEVEVFFDKAPPGGVRARRYGAVVARFVREGRTADDAIRERLQRLGPSARNWTVVSSDRMVQREGRAARAQVLSAEDFAQQLLRALEDPGKLPGDDLEAGLSADEVDEWLQLFGGEDEGD